MLRFSSYFLNSLKKNPQMLRFNNNMSPIGLSEFGDLQR